MGPTSPSLVALVEGIGGRVLPIFLTQTLKASGSVLGLVEGVAGATQLQGKELSFNNLVDLDACWELAQELHAGEGDLPAVQTFAHRQCKSCPMRNSLRPFRMARAECLPSRVRSARIRFTGWCPIFARCIKRNSSLCTLRSSQLQMDSRPSGVRRSKGGSS